MVTIALIPVKELSLAKARLAPMLDGAGRGELALTMFRDVLAAALACGALDGVAVTSRDEEVLAIAEQAGATPLPEPGGLNEALSSAAEKLAAHGPSRLLVIAADVPLAAPAEIDAVARADGGVVVVPSRDGGTNALAISPGAIAFSFGPGSARQHLEAAERAGVRAQRLDVPRLALDIDTPADLQRLREAVAAGEAVGPNTRAALERLGLLAPARTV
jgi:2-phospho-L-lactate guanylyltransferase